MATEYFAESIWSTNGFWGSKCIGYLQYIFGWCNGDEDEDDPDDDEDVEETERPAFAMMGERCNRA